MATEVTLDEMAGQGTTKVPPKRQEVSLQQMEGFKFPSEEDTATGVMGDYLSRAGRAAKVAIATAALRPSESLRAASRAVASGAVDAAEIIGVGMYSLAQALAVSRSGADGAQALTSNVEHNSQTVKHVNDLVSKFVSVNLAAAHAKDPEHPMVQKAMGDLLNILPEYPKAWGDTVFAKTGNALAAAGAQTLATALMFTPEVGSKVLKGIETEPSLRTAFDGLATTDPPVARALADHVRPADPTLWEYMKGRMKSADRRLKNPDAQKRLGRDAARAQIEGPPQPPPTSPSGGHRWYRDPGAIPGEPVEYLDVGKPSDENLNLAQGRIVEQVFEDGPTKYIAEWRTPKQAAAGKPFREIATMNSLEGAHRAVQDTVDSSRHPREASYFQKDKPGRQSVYPKTPEAAAAALSKGLGTTVTVERLGAAARTSTRKLTEALSEKEKFHSIYSVQPTKDGSFAVFNNQTKHFASQKFATEKEASEELEIVRQQLGEDPVVYLHMGAPVSLSAIRDAFRFGHEQVQRIPGVNIAEGEVAEIYDWIVRNIAPEARGPVAKAAGAIIAKHVAIEAQRTSSFFHRSATRHTYWNNRAQDARAFMRGFERGQTFADPLMNEVAQKYRQWAQDIYDQDVKTGFTYEPVDHYLYHVFEDGDELAKVFDQRFGNKWKDPKFTKDRTFDLYEQALHAINPRTGKPFQPKYTNPEDIMLARQHASDVAQMQAGILRELEHYGFARRKVEGQPPPNYPHTEHRSPTGERYYVHNAAFQIIHNAFLSKSLWTAPGPGGKAFRGLMTVKNTIVPVRLALSAFHPIHVMMIDMAAGQARAMKDVLAGHQDPVKFLADMIKATANPAASLQDAVSFLWGQPGSRLLRVYQAKVADSEITPEDRSALLYMAEGGLIPEMSSQYRTKAFDKYKGAIERNRAAMLHVPRLFFAIIDLLQKPIFEQWIPSLKIASYLKDVEVAFRTDPGLLQDNLRRTQALRKLAKSVDNRYGEMSYNTLFWNRWVKDIAVLDTLSLGWQLAFLREFGGGGMDVVKASADGKPGKIARGDLDRPLFSALYMTGALGLGALISYTMFYSKHKDQSMTLKDYVYPRVGEDVNGKPSRVNTMQYTRELGSLYLHARDQGILAGLSHIAASKASGVFGLVAESATGVNSFGEEIRDPDGTFMQKLGQNLKYVLTDIEPISVQQRGSTGKSATLSALGFTPAPQYVTDTPTEAAIRYTFNKYRGEKQVPYEKALYSHDAKKLKGLDRGSEEYTNLLDSMKEKYQLSPGEVGRLQTAIRSNVDPTIRMFSRLDWPQQKRILDKMTSEERAKYLPHANKEHLRYRYQPPEEE